MQTTISQQGQRFQFDVVVIGSGIAALCYVLDLLKLRPQTRIAILTKEKLGYSNSSYAQGGVAAAILTDDINAHIKDTLLAGDGLCNVSVVKNIVELGSESIEYLLKQGVPFDRDDENNLICGKEAGHSARRIYHVGDKTGAVIITNLVSQLKKHSQVEIFEYHTAINLITQREFHKPACFPEVVGVYALEEKTGLVNTFVASVIVLATGGAGKVYRYTSNSNVTTGDGVAMAVRAGARVDGLEFYQFHPTLLYHTKINNFLISEALRGEGA
jgi:L-aspartate oxidase